MKNKEKKQKKTKEKKQKVVLEPIPGLLGEATDYRIYNMTLNEQIVGFLIGFAVAVLVIFVFFRNIPFALIVGAVAGVMIQKPYEKYLNEKRSKKLLNDFRSLLESLSTSYSSGRNTQGAFEDALSDLESIYGDESDIVRETQIIVAGMNNNINVEDLLRNFADRSGLEDISSFADVFEVSYRQGANINKIISTTRDIINDKISVQMDINSSVSGAQNELNIMMIMPIIVFIGLSGMGGSMTIVTNTPLNVIVKLIALGVFVAAYFIGRKIVNIKI